MPSLKRSRSRRSIAIIAGLAVIVIVGAGVRALSDRTAQPTSAHPPPAVPVTAAVATRKDVPEIIDAIGNVQSIDSVSVVPRVTGTIESIEFTPGKDVKKGQMLFVIDRRPYQAALDQAKGQLAHDEGLLAEAQVDLQRYQTLQKEKSIAAQTAQDQQYVVEQDKGTVAVDQANVEAAQLNLDFSHITAPISGRAGALQVDVGNVVGPSSGTQTSGSTSSSSGQTARSSTGVSADAGSSASNVLVTIVQLKPIYVNFNVPQTDLAEIIQNQAKSPLRVDAYSQAGKLLGTGQLTVINNQVNTSTGTAMLQATFANEDETLWPGEYASVQLVVGTRRNVVTIPASAVMVGPNGDYVYVIGAGNKVERVNVQQTARRGGISVIGKGISDGQQVVSTGQYRLDNGTEVAIQQTAAPSPAGQTAANPVPATPDPPP